MGKMLVIGVFDLAQWLVSCAVWVRVGACVQCLSDAEFVFVLLGFHL